MRHFMALMTKREQIKTVIIIAVMVIVMHMIIYIYQTAQNTTIIEYKKNDIAFFVENWQIPTHDAGTYPVETEYRL